MFVRFAAEAETATMYTSDALASELKRQSGRSVFHSISICGRDALANSEFLAAAFEKWTPTLPIMIDTDGQRPDAVTELKKHVKLVQVTIDLGGPDATIDLGMKTLSTAAAAGTHHALVLTPREETSDSQMLRLIERVHAASSETIVVIHPMAGAERASLDRRWSTLLELVGPVHSDVRVMLRVPPPAGMK
jgi:signal recognition particle GTPase